ncbi:TonB-dependent receptor [Lewinella sp. LCG006]|uniref:TonB-dependent receptor domain-containing protein n=1 Tax=Lewinella sp. LCG006 TaxID=3231911 RepID=UPI00345F224C
MILPKALHLQSILFGSFFLLSVASLFAQQDTLVGGVIPQEIAGVDMPLNDGGYQAQNKTGAVVTIAQKDFNQGLISDPLLLLQGRVPGVQVYNRGGDPNVMSLIRIRGLSSYAQQQPLYVIDGVVGASIQNVDPNDITSMSILKDGASQAMYGIRASNGVVLISTVGSDFSKDTTIFSYQGQAAISTAYPGVAVLDAAAFRQQQGADFGATTNWLEEIQRDGIANTHRLAVAGQRGNTHYQLAGNYRQVEGVLNKSGFSRINTRMNIASELIEDMLEVQVTASFTDQNSQLGFNEAFRYAVTFNPTNPILAQNSPFPLDTEQFGGYFESVGLFDAFNPKALVEQNERDGRLQAFNTAALLKYKIGTGLSLNFRYAYQQVFSNERAYYSPQSYFRGNAYGPRDENKGRADLNDQEDAFSLYELFGTFQKSYRKSTMDLMLGAAYQDGNHEDQFLGLYGFANPDLIGTKRIGSYEKWVDVATRTDTINNAWSNKVSAFFGRMNFDFADKLVLNASLRYEGASKLGENNRWGLFPGIGAAINFKELWNMEKIDQFRLRVGYGVTGGLPDRGGLSQERVVLIQQTNNSIVENIRWTSNPSLKWEEKKEMNIGFDFQKGGVTVFADGYIREVKDWITLQFVGSSQRYGNLNALSSRGMELGLSLQLAQTTRFDYSTGVIFSTFNTRYADEKYGPYFATEGGGPFFNPAVTVRTGAELGAIVGPVFTGVVAGGNQVLEDVNQDGQLVTDAGSAFSSEGDFRYLGNGLPDFELGWSHQLRTGQWQVQLFLRGAFGHSLVNMQRIYYEPRQVFGTRFYNFVDTELAIDELRVPRYSSLYVEKADFLKLDNLRIARSFSLGKNGGNKSLQISLTGQNLITITNYTGADPEPSLEDLGPTAFGSQQNAPIDANRLAPGVDRRNHYLPSRTVVLGVGVVF